MSWVRCLALRAIIVWVRDVLSGVRAVQVVTSCLELTVCKEKYLLSCLNQLNLLEGRLVQQRTLLRMNLVGVAY